ncbi:hypothetical protein [Microtetraspora malaysiensis]|uniref:Uncharacterized protein n=1 Tax=Microtetraspora malaysiensis TaxID=161358 RepID=A0ABW6T241_9ACTN
MRLPTALAPWSDSLSHLTPDLAMALGPLVRGIHQLVSRRESACVEQGSLDGFEGVSRRGHPELMLVSEWLLADEAPVEFLRRAAQRELLHLAPAVRRPSGRGRVAMLADTGPDQAGAGRLVQLASLIVLHRRAVALGTELAVGILGQKPGGWMTGDLPELLKAWLDGRRPVEPDVDDVSAWTSDVTEADEAWILTGPQLSSKLPARRRVVSSRESAWGEHGVTHVRVECNDISTELAVPDGPVAVRALRGQEFKRAPVAVNRPEGATTLRFPIFPSSARRILARGETANELVSVQVPQTAGRRAATPRLHRLAGPILAASVLGNRIVVVIEQDRMLRVHVIGNPLGKVRSVSVPIESLDLDLRDIEQICAEGLAPLFYQSGDVISPLGDDGWWRLRPDSAAYRTDLVAIAPSTGSQFDQPHFVTWGPHGKHVSVPGSFKRIEPEDDVVVLGGGGYARSTDAQTWHVVHPRGVRASITVEPESSVLGLAFDENEPMLVTAGRGGVLLRLVRPSGTRALTGWSGLPSLPVIHPTQPLIAAMDETGRLKVGDLITGETLLRVATSR